MENNCVICDEVFIARNPRQKLCGSPECAGNYARYTYHLQSEGYHQRRMLRAGIRRREVRDKLRIYNRGYAYQSRLAREVIDQYGIVPEEGSSPYKARRVLWEMGVRLPRSAKEE